MTGFRIKLPDQEVTYGKGKTDRVKDPQYLDFIRTLPCIISGYRPVDAAHISFANRACLAPGRGLRRKVSDRWTLPLARHLHDTQHGMNEAKFWEHWGVDPHHCCLVIWGAWQERGENSRSLIEHWMIELRQTMRRG